MASDIGFVDTKYQCRGTGSNRHYTKAIIIIKKKYDLLFYSGTVIFPAFLRRILRHRIFN